VKALPGLAVCFLSVGIVRAQTDCFWLDAEINNRPARLMFDTGTEGTGLYPEAVKRLGLKIDVPVPDIPSEHGKVGVGKTKVAELKLAGASARTRLAIFPSDLASYDLPFDGIVGWPEVKDNVFLVEASTLTLKSVEQVAQEAATWTRFRVLTNYDILALEVPGPETTPLSVVIDTGKVGGVTLSPQRWQQWITAHPGRPRTLRSYNMFGAGNQLKEESWADEIALGSLVLTDVPVMEANSAEVARGSTGYAGTLGMAALKRLNLVIDGKNHVAYVRPKRTAAAAYPHNRLGAVFVQEQSQGIALFARVAPDSPAAEAGIRDGDVLLKVNGHDVAGLTTDQFLVPLILEWDRPAATEFDLALERGIEVRKTKVVLQDILKPGKMSSPPAKVLASEVKWLMDLADTAYRETNYDQAINNYAEIIRLKPDAAEAFNGRGGSYYFKGSNDLALADYNEAIRLNPSLAAAIGNRGNAYKQKKDYAHAISDYDRVLQLEPGHPAGFRTLAQALAACPRDSLRDGKKAIQYARKACELASWKDAATIDVLAMAYAANGDFSEAIKWEQTFLRATLPEDVRASALARLKLYQQNKPYIESDL
jgi:tetratricopeptide (TPR) repeat protein